jgi:hypothetical protein
MGALSSQDKIRLRDQHPHKVTAYMSVMVPEIVYVGTINYSESSYAYLKVVDVFGDPLDLKGGETVFIGTAQGLSDICKRRFRYMTGDDDDIMFLDESISSYWSEYEQGDFVTVYRDYTLWPRYPFISSVANDDGSATFLFYKDFNVPYAGHNAYPEPVAICGSHRAAWLVSGTVDLAFDGSDSYAMTPGAAISSYVWECDDATVDSPTTSSTDITFTSAGIYWVILTVTDDEGQFQSTYRAVFIHDDDNPPYLDWGFRSPLTGSWKQSGWDASLEVRGDADVTEFPDNALIVIWTDEYFGDEEVHIGDSGNILFVGYIGEESVSKEIDTGYVNFSAGTINQLLDSIYMYSVSMSSVASGETPTNWNYYMNELTTARAVHHYWKWHSTLFEICDVILPVGNTSEIIAQDYDEGTLYQAIETFTMEHGIFAHVCCARNGILHVEVDIQMLNDTDRAAVATVMEISEEDRRGDADIELFRDTQFRTHYATLTGVSKSGQPYGAQAISSIYESRGTRLASFERVILDDQAHALELCGRVFGIVNLETIEVRIPIAGHYYGAMPLVPQEWFTISLAADDTKRGIVWVNKKVVVREVRLELDIQIGVIKMEIICEPEARTFPADILFIHGDETWNIPLPPFPLFDPYIFNFPDPPVPFALYFGEPVRNLKNKYWPQHTEENAASAVRIYSDNVEVIDATESNMGWKGYRGPLYDGNYFYFIVRLGAQWGQGQLWRIDSNTGESLMIQVADGQELEEFAGSPPVVMAPGVIAYGVRKYDNIELDFYYRVDIMDFNIAEDASGISTLFSWDWDELPLDWIYGETGSFGAAFLGNDFYIRTAYVADPVGISAYIKQHVFWIYNYQTSTETKVEVDVADADYAFNAAAIHFDGIFFADVGKVVFLSSLYVSTNPDWSENWLHVLELDQLTVKSTQINARSDQEGYNYNLCPDFANGRLYFVNRDEQGPEGGDGIMYYDIAAETFSVVGGDVENDFLASREFVYRKIVDESIVHAVTGASGNVDIGEDLFNDGICYQADDVENRIWRLDTDDEVLRGYHVVTGESREIDVSGTALFPLPVGEGFLEYHVALIGDKFVIQYRHSIGDDTTHFFIVKGS